MFRAIGILGVNKIHSSKMILEENTRKRAKGEIRIRIENRSMEDSLETERYMC